MRGVYRGRKKKPSNNLVVSLIDRAGAGDSKSKLARDFEISRQTLYRYLRSTQGTPQSHPESAPT
ncbi:MULTISPECIES: helix-turn-helix domain-containing protein [Pseudomonas]|uniref:Helix-turn-helix domain-containing protein n=1 Tax=Pseudomonas shahriarae TaxID=2745512 RepID=A0ABT5NH55_9PSED|nr:MULTISPECIES: helix-turn-helix domain-containing protein [Pseudomonas]MCU0213054.1 helix-turn-helix domain-containing protein [Pseudomonas shahriarae]MDD0987147.1 helix-turn-helix domain-containing protein [Pseudomonas shahriarae]MDD1032237.1 helix-turn-helix domain-containing protein [Pseudomonas shahriarae]MDZ4300721.1 helix-turn-helix domain-containing protein [Pseudomonas sp.]